jgi:hypothetical protein
MKDWKLGTAMRESSPSSWRQIQSSRWARRPVHPEVEEDNWPVLEAAYSRESNMRRSTDVPIAVRVFREAGTTGRLTVWKVVTHRVNKQSVLFAW